MNIFGGKAKARCRMYLGAGTTKERGEEERLGERWWQGGRKEQEENVKTRFHWRVAACSECCKGGMDHATGKCVVRTNTVKCTPHNANSSQFPAYFTLHTNNNSLHTALHTPHSTIPHFHSSLKEPHCMLLCKQHTAH